MSLKGKHQKCHSHTHQKMPSNCPTLIRRGMFPFQPWSFLTQVRFFEGQILNCILESLQVSSLWKPKLSGNLSFVTCQCVQPHLPKDFSHQTRNGNNHRCTWLALGRDTEAFWDIRFSSYIDWQRDLCQMWQAQFGLCMNSVVLTKESAGSSGKSILSGISIYCRLYKQ